MTNQLLRVYNTLNRKKEPFVTQVPGKVSFYVCGVTVYDDCHLGHARAYVAFDTIKRYLEYSGFDVTHIQNFTDIDDKIIARANETQTDYKVLTAKYIDEYHADMGNLNIKKATAYPKATEHMDAIIAMIETLIQKGHAYNAQGDVYFSVASDPNYGKLSNKILEDLEEGARVDVSEKKEAPLDFALWKSAKPGEPTWDSPWGKGRPGWHIECSAMSTQALGHTIDIHGGGQDLVFPHHENECAQSECATGHPFVKYWLHNGFVTIKNQKMSKSKKNFFTIKELLNSYSGEVIRFYLLKMHYRHPLNFSDQGLDEAKQALSRLQTCLKLPDNQPPISPDKQTEFAEFKTRFESAMNDDFNYTEAIGVLFDLCRYVNSTKQGASLVRELGSILGLFFTKTDTDISLSSEIETLIEKRNQAKSDKNYQLSDEIRDTLKTTHNVVLKDTPTGVTWEISN